MVWKVGDFVLHRKMTGWGVGKVFQSNGQDISVFFVNHGKCNLPQNFPWIEMAPDALTGHPLLQNVAPGVLEDRLVFLRWRSVFGDLARFFLRVSTTRPIWQRSLGSAMTRSMLPTWLGSC